MRGRTKGSRQAKKHTLRKAWKQKDNTTGRDALAQAQQTAAKTKTPPPKRTNGTPD